MKSIREKITTEDRQRKFSVYIISAMKKRANETEKKYLKITYRTNFLKIEIIESTDENLFRKQWFRGLLADWKKNQVKRSNKILRPIFSIFGISLQSICFSMCLVFLSWARAIALKLLYTFSFWFHAPRSSSPWYKVILLNLTVLNFTWALSWRMIKKFPTLLCSGIWLTAKNHPSLYDLDYIHRCPLVYLWLNQTQILQTPILCITKS